MISSFQVNQTFMGGQKNYVQNTNSPYQSQIYNDVPDQPYQQTKNQPVVLSTTASSSTNSSSTRTYSKSSCTTTPRESIVNTS